MDSAAGHPIIDMRLRPPVGSFVRAKMFALGERSAGMGNSTGMLQARSARENSLELTIQEMDTAGVTIAIMPGLTRATELDGQIPNEELAAIQRQTGGRFIGLTGIDPSDRKRAAEEIDKTREHYGFPGIALEPGLLAQPMHCDDRRIYPLYAKCEDEGIPVSIMTGGNAGPDPSFMDPVHLDHVLADFPTLKVVAAHGSWPYVTEVIHVAFRRPNLYLSPDIYTFLPGGALYLDALRGVLKERMLYGSAYPFLPIVDPVVRTREFEVPDDILRNLFYRNASELFGLDLHTTADSE
jgi:uncharacterized protein